MDFKAIVKRFFDFLISFLFLILLLPVFALIAIGIRLDSPGPVFFRQRRVGLNGKPFTILKFRTMHHHVDPLAESPSNHTDPRITKVGAVLRKYGLDEFPQLLNILRGDMSFVGPRPQIEKELAEFAELYPDMLTKRLTLRPGLTCFWVVTESGPKTRPVREMFEADCSYVDAACLRTDINILYRTFNLIMQRR